MAFDLTRVLRALLFASPAPLSVREIQAVVARFHEQAETEKEGGGKEDVAENPSPAAPPEVPSLVTASQIREGMEVVGRHFEEADEVFRLQETHQGYRLVTANDTARWVRLLHRTPKPARLSRAALETLAIVAYRQPVVRAEIESIRGVSADNALNRLLERELIRILGRADLPGRPLLYATTEAFLELVGVRSLEELPASDVLSSREIDEWLRKDRELKQLTEHEIGLPEVEGDSEERQEVMTDSGMETEEK